MRKLSKFLIACLSVLHFASGVQGQDYARYSQSKARLIAEHMTFDPVVGTRVALDIIPDPGWHTYWLNPGDSGAAPILEFASPTSLEFSVVHFPTPYRFDVGPLSSFGYDQRVLLTADVLPTKNVPSNIVTINLSAEWLVCKVECIPAFADFSIDLPVAPAKAHSEHARTFELAERSWPKPISAQFNVQALANPTMLLIEPDPWKVEDFFPTSNSGLEIKRPKIESEGKQIKLRLDFNGNHTELNNSIEGILVLTDGSERIGLEVNAPFESKQSFTLFTLLIFGFLGGLILNLMPCVLPVVGIKMLSVTKHAHATRPRIRMLVGAYVAGVMLSFVGLALILLGLQWGGASLGWGFQLQSPTFVMSMVILFFLIGANLLGWLPIHWVPQWQPKRAGPPDSLIHEFFTGVLAVLVATPCTTPFMGAAVGAALTLGPVACVMVFSSLGFGLAFPYAMLILTPKASRLLPKPGYWMETFRQFLAFPMFATTLWLLWVLSHQTGGLAWVRGSGTLLALGFAIWMRPLWPRVAISLGVAVLISSLVATSTLAPVTASVNTHSKMDWIPFTPQAIEESRAENPVFVDFTAAWCITCQVNKNVTFHDENVIRFLKEHNVVTIQADWTNRDPLITSYLQKYGRAGVPMYLFYAPGEADPLLLPEILTPSIFIDKVSVFLETNRKGDKHD